ncbi:MAG: hypothetical protein V4722_28075 [Bacteroidota bacterium]
MKHFKQLAAHVSNNTKLQVLWEISFVSTVILALLVLAINL